MSKKAVVTEIGTHSIQITREFDAPCDRVFRVLTDPALIPQWWGPSDLTTRVDKMEVRQGGIWRYTHTGAKGEEYGFHGVYHQISPEQLVYTFEFEGMPGHVLLETVRLEDLGDKTRLNIIDVFQSAEDRDGMMQSGMEEGTNESYDRLDEILAQKDFAA